jgi:hypothetical protein
MSDPAHPDHAALYERAQNVKQERDIDATLLAYCVEMFSEHPSAAETIRQLGISPRMFAPPSFLAINQTAARALRHVASDLELWAQVRAAWLALLRTPIEQLAAASYMLDNRLEMAMTGLGLSRKRLAENSINANDKRPMFIVGAGAPEHSTPAQAPPPAPADPLPPAHAPPPARPPVQAPPRAPTPDPVDPLPPACPPSPTYTPAHTPPPVQARPTMSTYAPPPPHVRPVPKQRYRPPPPTQSPQTHAEAQNAPSRLSQIRQAVIQRRPVARNRAPDDPPLSGRNRNYLAVRPHYNYHCTGAQKLGADALEPDDPVCNFYGCGRRIPIGDLAKHVSRPLYALCKWQSFFCVDHLLVMEEFTKQPNTPFCHGCGVLHTAQLPVALRPSVRAAYSVPLCRECFKQPWVDRQLSKIRRRHYEGASRNAEAQPPSPFAEMTTHAPTPMPFDFDPSEPFAVDQGEYFANSDSDSDYSP